MIHGSWNLTRYNSWLNKKPSNRLQKLNLLIAIIGVGVSLFISCLALRLTYRYGESNTQINALTKIASQQQQQIDKLQDILIQAKKQTMNSDRLIGQMKVSNDKLLIQSLY